MKGAVSNMREIVPEGRCRLQNRVLRYRSLSSCLEEGSLAQEAKTRFVDGDNWDTGMAMREVARRYIYDETLTGVVL